ncbi:MAG: hypothetical protein KY475_19665 [Planctomycetes bacterium]|nr:hypothetical protein [Planctomycetota bacterium]
MAKRRNNGGGSPAAFRSLAQLPQSPEEVWQAEICRSPAWMRIAGQPQRPWMALVTNRTEDLVLAHEMPDAQPTPKQLQEKLAEAMRSAEFGAPHRPSEVQVRSDELHAKLRAPLEAVGIRCVVVEQLEHVDFVLRDLAKHLQGGRTVPALVDAPGVGPEQIRSYFEAAAGYYRQSPWRRLPGDTPIKVECSLLESGPWYAAVMGQAGMTFGLALHEGAEALGETLASDVPEEAARHASALSLMYGEKVEIAVRDLDAAEKYGWPVAGAAAYPLALRVNPGRTVRAPLRWELQLLEACLWAIPDFLAVDAERARIRTPRVSESMELILSWAAG